MTSCMIKTSMSQNVTGTQAWRDSSERPKEQKMDMGFGRWNIGSL